MASGREPELGSDVFGDVSRRGARAVRRRLGIVPPCLGAGDDTMTERLLLRALPAPRCSDACCISHLRARDSCRVRRNPRWAGQRTTVNEGALLPNSSLLESAMSERDDPDDEEVSRQRRARPGGSRVVRVSLTRVMIVAVAPTVSEMTKHPMTERLIPRLVGCHRVRCEQPCEQPVRSNRPASVATSIGLADK